MKTTLVVFGLLVSASVTQAEAPKSVDGKWKVKSVMISGKPVEFSTCGFRKGAVCELKQKGSLVIDGSVRWSWHYNARGGIITLASGGMFGVRYQRHVFSVAADGNEIKLKFWDFFRPSEITLTPD